MSMPVESQLHRKLSTIHKPSACLPPLIVNALQRDHQAGRCGARLPSCWVYSLKSLVPVVFV